jgi:hypothetical protein
MEKCNGDLFVMNLTEYCFNNCSGKGVCRNERCICDKGFIGDDCQT